MSETASNLPRDEYRDGLTGVRVIRLTPADADYHHLYFTNHSFYSDGKTIVVGSNRTGASQLFQLDVVTGQLLRLTGEQAVQTHGAALDPKRGVVYYFADRTLRSVQPATSKTQEHYRAPDGFKTSIISVSSCGRYLAFVYTEELPSSTASGRIYSGMHEYYFQHPRSVVIRLDLQTGRPSAIWGETTWISHVQISPVDPDLVLFCREGAYLVGQRMWLVSARTSVCRPLYDQQPNEHVAHEYFLQDGRVAAQLAVYPDEAKVFTGDPGVHYHLIVRPDGTDVCKFVLPSRAPRHIQSNSDASLHVGDCAFPTPDFPDGGTLMSLMRHLEGRVEVTPLCRHGSDFSTQISHPHPIFSPDGRHVLFSSNAGGRCGVYLAEVPGWPLSEHRQQ